MVGLWFLRPSWFWGAVIGKKRGGCLRSMPKHLSASWAAVQQFYELPKPIKSHQEPCVLWCSAHPHLLTVLWKRTAAPHQVPAPLQPHAFCSGSPEDPVTSLTPALWSQVSPTPGVSGREQTGHRGMSGEDPKWPPGQGKEWEA